jgi:hypothetical protein
MERDVSVFPWTGRRAGEIELFMLLPDDKWRRTIQSFLLFVLKSWIPGIPIFDLAANIKCYCSALLK